MSKILRSSTGQEYIFNEKDRLGHGAFGDVFKGFDKQKLCPVAIKRVNNSILDRYGEEFLRCLGNEANTLQEMGTGLNTVVILDCFKSAHCVNIIMEFCEGGSLRDKLNKAPNGQLSEHEAVLYIMEITNGLAAMHNTGRMHRDIKPDNIFFKDGHCKVGDFGFATKQPEATLYVGTDVYMAPELLDCGPENPYNKQVDIWALGVMFHEMLFGKRPYVGPPTQLADIIRENPYEMPETPSTTQETKALLKKMLTVDPEERITANMALKQLLLLKLRLSGKEILMHSASDEGGRQVGGDGSEYQPKEMADSWSNSYIHRINSKLKNYLQCCEFFLKLTERLLPYLSSERSYILDNLHIFVYYMLKFAYNKFTYLLENLEKKECPRKLLKPIETEYWNDYANSNKLHLLKWQTIKGQHMIDLIFKRFRIGMLRRYLERVHRDTEELNTIYNEKLNVDSTSSFRGKMMEAIYVLQKMSQSKKDELSKQLGNVMMDLQFSQVIEENMDHYEREIDVEGYMKNKEKGEEKMKLKQYVKARTW